MADVTLSNIKAYLVGNFRYWLYYDPSFKFMMRTHIREQIDMRIKNMDPVCYNQGSCELCGCNTTALQMSNKACDKPCYPHMMNKKDWESFKIGSILWDTHTKLFWSLRSDILKIVNLNMN